MTAQLDPSNWTCSSNDALFVSVAEPQGAFSFHPKFTYPIFGEAEQIFGYKGLRIDLAFDCKSLKPFLNHRYTEKVNNELKDINEQVLPFLDKGDVVIGDEAKWLDAIDDEKFEIPGKCVSSYTLPIDVKNTYKVYKFKPKEGSALHRRMQIFVLLYIEAGSYIDEDDPVWDVYCIYKCPKDGSKETFVGFATAYAYWKYEGHEEHDASPDQLDMHYRNKISQFVILPAFQGKRHGQHLYETIAAEWMANDKVKELTVEDPSETFDVLRDRCDMQRLLSARDFLGDVGTLPVSDEWIEQKRQQEKMDRRQFQRCVEMGLLYKLQKQQQAGEPSGIEGLSEKQVRLLVKKRLYRKNRDALVELEPVDMRDKLQTAYEGIKDDYVKILRTVRVHVDRKRVAAGDADGFKRPRQPEGQS